MDEYGSFGDSEEDYEEISRYLKDNWPVVFAWSPNQCDAYVVMITGAFKRLGTLPFGGNPSGSCMVSILLRGAYWIDLQSEREVSSEYVAEKFGLGPGDDSNNIARLLNGIRSANKKKRSTT